MCLLTKKLEEAISGLESALVDFTKESSVQNCELICVWSRRVHAKFVELTCWQDAIPVNHQQRIVVLFNQCAEATRENLPSEELAYISPRLEERRNFIENIDIERDLVA